MHSGKKLMWNKKKQFPFQYVMKLQEHEKIINKIKSYPFIEAENKRKDVHQTPICSKYV